MCTMANLGHACRVPHHHTFHTWPWCPDSSPETGWPLPHCLCAPDTVRKLWQPAPLLLGPNQAENCQKPSQGSAAKRILHPEEEGVKRAQVKGVPEPSAFHGQSIANVCGDQVVGTHVCALPVIRVTGCSAGPHPNHSIRPLSHLPLCLLEVKHAHLMIRTSSSQHLQRKQQAGQA